MNETNNPESFRPLLSRHNAILEKYKTLLAPTNTNNIINPQPMYKTSGALNRNVFQQEIPYNNDYNKQDKAKQVDNILNNLQLKRTVQEYHKPEIQQNTLNINLLKEKYSNYINNPGFKYENPSPISNPNDEIQRIKSKYFSHSTQNVLQQDNPIMKQKYKQFLDDELSKYQEMAIEKIKPIIYNQKDDTNNNMNLSFNDNINMTPIKQQDNYNSRYNNDNKLRDEGEIQDKEDNTLLISKMSVFDNNPNQMSNSKFNVSQRNDDQTKNNISYTYSKSSNEEDNQDQVNYDEVISIVQRMEKLKEINYLEQQTPIQTPIKDTNEAKDITKSVLDSITKTLNLHMNSTDNEKKVKQPSVGIKSRTQKPKVKLVSFEEFLEFDD